MSCLSSCYDRVGIVLIFLHYSCLGRHGVFSSVLTPPPSPQLCFFSLSPLLPSTFPLFLFLRLEDSPLTINLYSHNTSGTSFRKLGHVVREHLNSKSRFKKSSQFFSVHWSSETSVFSGSIGNYIFYCQIVQRRKNGQDEVGDGGGRTGVRNCLLWMQTEFCKAV